MTTIGLPFGTYDPFRGAGTSAPLPFYAMYPPEVGCFGLGLMGSRDSTTTIAKLTDRAKLLLARGIVDGTSVQVIKFAFGSGGFDPADPLRPIDVDTSASSLIMETYRKTVDVYENPSPDGNIRSFAARLAREEFIGGIGEFGLIARIRNSPITAENNLEFLFAIGHQGLRASSRNHVDTYRIIVVV